MVSATKIGNRICYASVAFLCTLFGCDGSEIPSESSSGKDQDTTSLAPPQSPVQERKVTFFLRGAEFHVVVGPQSSPSDSAEAGLLGEVLSDPNATLVVDGALPGELWAYSAPEDRHLVDSSIGSALARLGRTGDLSQPGRPQIRPGSGINKFPAWTRYRYFTDGGAEGDSPGILDWHQPYVGNWYNDKISSLWVEGNATSDPASVAAVRFYEHANYGGKSVVFRTPGYCGGQNRCTTFHNMWDFCMTSFGWCFTTWNDQASSVYIDN